MNLGQGLYLYLFIYLFIWMDGCMELGSDWLVGWLLDLQDNGASRRVSPSPLQ